MSFVDREEPTTILRKKAGLSYITEYLLDGQSGIGKTALIKETFKEHCLYIEPISTNYFLRFLYCCVELGLHEYFMGISDCSYRNEYYTYSQGLDKSTEAKVEFIVANKNRFRQFNEVFVLEAHLAKFIIEQKYTTIVFDNFENCDQNDFGQILKVIDILAKNKCKLKIIYAINSDNKGIVYDRLYSRDTRYIKLEGLDKQYIEAIIREYVGMPELECGALADYFVEKCQGNPCYVLKTLKDKVDTKNVKNLSQETIYQLIKRPSFGKLRSIEKHVLLFVSALRSTPTVDKLEGFLLNSKLAYEELDIMQAIRSLAENELISIGEYDIVFANSLIKQMFSFAVNGDISLIRLIYKYQQENDGKLRDDENADMLIFVKNGNVLDEEDYRKDLLDYTLKAARKCYQSEDLKGSVYYFNVLMQYPESLTTNDMVVMMKSYYYNAMCSEILQFLLYRDDKECTDYDYWYWKGNIMYTLNRPEAIECLQKAMQHASNEDEKILARLLKNLAISELPELSGQTYQDYTSILKEYEGKDYKSLALVYRNSLPLGGNDTIQACDKGIEIAQKYSGQDMREEIVKLQHNKHFELFRMGKLDNCIEAFTRSADYFQDYPNRRYECAYGLNNLALVYLVKDDIEQAKLYVQSAMIYAGTPYSIITTNVNANLINSLDPSYDVDEGARKIEELLKKFECRDNRRFRKAYFSIAISYINHQRFDKAIEYVRKSEPYLESGRHINRYVNLCKKLNIKPVKQPTEIIDESNGYYDFYSNSKFELWLLSHGHI